MQGDQRKPGLCELYLGFDRTTQRRRCSPPGGGAIGKEHKLCQLLYGGGVPPIGPDFIRRFHARNMGLPAERRATGCVPAWTAVALQLGDTIKKQKITTVWLTSGLFNQMVEEQPDS